MLILIQIFTSGFVNKVLLALSRIHSFLSCLRLVLHSQLQGRIVTTKTAGAALWLGDGLSVSCTVCVLETRSECVFILFPICVLVEIL